MASEYEINGTPIESYCMSAIDAVTSSYKFNLKDYGFTPNDVMLMKSGVTALEGAWFTSPLTSNPFPYTKDETNLPLVSSYGACVPDLSNPSLTLSPSYSGGKYFRYHSGYIQCSTNSFRTNKTNLKQSKTGLVFIEMQAAGGGGGKGYCTNLGVGGMVSGGSGGGGGAYLGLLVDLNKVMSFYVDSIGSGGSKNGGDGGNTSINFHYSNKTVTLTCNGGCGGGDVDNWDSDGYSSGGKCSEDPGEDGITVIRRYYGKGSGKPAHAAIAVGAFTVNDGSDSGSFTGDNDSRSFGGVISDVSIKGGGGSPDVSQIYIGVHQCIGSIGAPSALRPYGKGGNGGTAHSDDGSWPADNFTCDEGDAGGDGIIYLYF